MINQHNDNKFKMRFSYNIEEEETDELYVYKPAVDIYFDKNESWWISENSITKLLDVEKKDIVKYLKKNKKKELFSSSHPEYARSFKDINLFFETHIFEDTYENYDFYLYNEKLVNRIATDLHKVELLEPLKNEIPKMLDYINKEDNLKQGNEALKYALESRFLIEIINNSNFYFSSKYHIAPICFILVYSVEMSLKGILKILNISIKNEKNENIHDIDILYGKLNEDYQNYIKKYFENNNISETEFVEKLNKYSRAFIECRYLIDQDWDDKYTEQELESTRTFFIVFYDALRSLINDKFIQKF